MDAFGFGELVSDRLDRLWTWGTGDKPYCVEAEEPERSLRCIGRWGTPGLNLGLKYGEEEDGGGMLFVLIGLLLLEVSLVVMVVFDSDMF